MHNSINEEVLFKTLNIKAQDDISFCLDCEELEIFDELIDIYNFNKIILKEHNKEDNFIVYYSGCDFIETPSDEIKLFNIKEVCINNIDECLYQVIIKYYDYSEHFIVGEFDIYEKNIIIDSLYKNDAYYLQEIVLKINEARILAKQKYKEKLLEESKKLKFEIKHSFYDKDMANAFDFGGIYHDYNDYELLYFSKLKIMANNLYFIFKDKYKIKLPISYYYQLKSCDFSSLKITDLSICLSYNYFDNIVDINGNILDCQTNGVEVIDLTFKVVIN